MHLTAFYNSLLLPESSPCTLNLAARGVVHCPLPHLSITLKLQTCPRSKRALPQHSCSGLGNSLCVLLLDKQVFHKNRQEEIYPRAAPAKRENLNGQAEPTMHLFQYCLFKKNKNVLLTYSWHTIVSCVQHSDMTFICLMVWSHTKSSNLSVIV